MAVDPDALLLDRAFQPFTETVAGVVSPFGLARGSLVLAVESQGVSVFWDVGHDHSPASLAIAAMTLFGARHCWRLIGRAERQVRHGTANGCRITLRGQRIAWLAIGGGCVLVLLAQGDLRAGFASLACLSWIALIYFVSCTPRPPSVQRAGRAAPAARC